MFSHSSHSRGLPHKHADAGFGLIELMVSIAVMVLVSAAIIVRQDSFNGAVLLRGQAYDVAFVIREAQLNAVSAVGGGGTNASSHRARIGVYFDTSSPLYQTFRDTNSDYFFNTTEVFGQPGTLGSRFEIREIRADGAVVGEGQLSIVFERPDFDALFYSEANEKISAEKVEIDIGRTDTADVRTVEVTRTGQIIVKPDPE
ncbi:MAG: hypothetical protein RL538_533 [Candidatus Parcubacteria bacterium]|jgi:prepilin-type N-terminal cleavage/methylation domain-containing protein